MGLLVGQALLAGLVGPVPVVMAGVLAEDRPEVAFVVDEHPVGALGSCCAYPSLGVTIRSRRPRWGHHYFRALAREDLVERVGELPGAVADEEAEGSGPVAEVHDQVGGLLSGPGAIRMGGGAEDVHVPGGRLHDEQHVQAPEEDRVDMEKVAGQQAVRLSAQERPPGGVVVAGAGRRAARRIRRAVAALMRWPSLDSSLCTRRYPRDGFSRASRSARSRISLATGGRPGLPG